MSEPTFHHQSGGLAEEAAFARRLARSLVRDEHEAEDIAQDAAVAALTRSDRPQMSIGAWLSGTVRNLARMRARSGARRRIREWAAAKAEGVPSAAEQAARAELLRRLAHAVAALPEPARSTLLLRYYDDLPPREIARRTGEAIDTVKSRLRRSLAELRRALDEQSGGGRREWTALLLPVGGAMEGIGSVAATAGAVVMSAKLKVVVAASVLALVLGATFSVRSSNPPEAEPEELLVVDAWRDGGRGEQGATEVGADAVTMMLEGTVLGPDDAPLEGVAVGIPRPGGVTWVQSDAAGRFRFEGISGGPTVAVRAAKLGYRFEGPRSIPVVAGGAPVTIRMIADRFIHVRGRVVGEGEGPLAGAVVGARMSGWSVQVDDIQAWLSLRHSREEVFSKVETGADGTFEMQLPSLLSHFKVVAHASGYAPGQSGQVICTADRWNLREDIRLDRLRMETGVVLDAATSRPIAGVRVGLAKAEVSPDGSSELRTDRAGAFEIGAVPGGYIHFGADGYLPASVWIRARRVPFEVRMHPARALSGRVVFPDGTPVPGAMIKAIDPDREAAGEELPKAVFAAPDGTFTVEGLWPAEWRLEVLLTYRAKANFCWTVYGPVSAGTRELRVEVPRGLSISGRLFDSDGEPYPHRVHISARPEDSTQTAPNGFFGASSNERGEYEVRGLSHGRYQLQVTGGQGAAPGVVSAEARNVVAGATDVDFRLLGGRTITGVVLDADEQPVPNRSVLALDPETLGLCYNSAHHGKTDEQGRFRIIGLSDETYRLILKPRAPDWLYCHLEGGEEVAAGATGLQLTLSYGGELSGVLQDAAGAPLPRTRVDVSSEDSGGILSTATLTDAQGRFRAVGLRRGRSYTLHAAGQKLTGLVPDRTNLIIKGN